MAPIVITGCHEFEVVEAIVEGIAIAVVDDPVRREFLAQVLFHDVAVLEPPDIGFSHFDESVSQTWI